MELVIEPSVTVITPTIGSTKLADAMESVRTQTYKNVKHLIVVDGPEYMGSVWKALSLSYKSSEVQVTSTPENTGRNSFYGHRIYAAYPHLINSDYTFFLDEDNWYESNHVESLVNVLNKGNDFAYSFRQIYDPDMNYVCHDNCEALGKWPIYFSHKEPQYLIDTSAFAFHTKFLQQVASLWHSGWGGDRRFFYAVKANAKWDCSYQHSLCYRLDGNPGSVNRDFFMQGNAAQLEHYNGVLPWLRT